jgi:hypothetical protein
MEICHEYEIAAMSGLFPTIAQAFRHAKTKTVHRHDLVTSRSYNPHPLVARDSGVRESL